MSVEHSGGSFLPLGQENNEGGLGASATSL